MYKYVALLRLWEWSLALNSRRNDKEAIFRYRGIYRLLNNVIVTLSLPPTSSSPITLQQQF